MRLKSNLYKDNYGNIFFSKTIQGERIVLPTHTKNPSTANKLHAVLMVGTIIVAPVMAVLGGLTSYILPKGRTSKVYLIQENEWEIVNY